MLSLSLIDSLLDAMRPGSRIILVGDAMQLASVDAGSVLGDIAGAPGVVGMRVAELTETHRFDTDSQIGRFAAAILAHDVELAQTVLGELDAQQQSFDEQSTDQPMLQLTSDLSVMSDLLIRHGMSLIEHAQRDPTAAVNQLDAMRVLCAHRTGPFGVSYWNQYTQRLLSDAGARVEHHDVGRPVMVTANDPTSGLFNGDVGVIVATDGGSRIAFPGSDNPALAPTTLEHLETVYAMTIHKSQGSEFDHVVVVLPPAQSPLATRELLYTAVTRAKLRVTLIGTIESVIAAMNRTSLRMSALRQRLE
jgi:exodeoxyribonuclease V alpha subunit